MMREKVDFFFEVLELELTKGKSSLEALSQAVSSYAFVYMTLAAEVDEELESIPHEGLDYQLSMDQFCRWTYDNETADWWDTECGEAFTLLEGSPTDNYMKFCPFCGRRIIDIPDAPETPQGR